MVARVFLVEKATRQFSDRKFLCPWQSSKFSKIFTSLSFCIETKVLDKVQFFKIPFHLGSVWQIYKYQTGVSSLSWAHSHLLSRITTELSMLFKIAGLYFFFKFKPVNLFSVFVSLMIFFSFWFVRWVEYDHNLTPCRCKGNRNNRFWKPTLIIG